MKTLIAFTLALCCVLTTYGQSDAILAVVNQNALDENRYEGINKSPYLFKDFVTAKAYNLKKDETEEYKVNYNGYTQEFEFQYKGEVIELDQSYYDVIEIASYIPSGDYSDKYVSETIKFVKGLDPKNPAKHQILVFENKELKVYKAFDTRLSTRETNDPARGVVKTQTFNPRFTYSLMKDGKSNVIGLSKKKVLAALNEGQLETFVKKNKIKLDSEKSLLRVLAYYHDVTVKEAPTSDAIAASN